MKPKFAFLQQNLDTLLRLADLEATPEAGVLPADQLAVLKAARRLESLLKVQAIAQGRIFPQKCANGTWAVLEEMALVVPPQTFELDSVFARIQLKPGWRVQVIDHQGGGWYWLLDPAGNQRVDFRYRNYEPISAEFTLLPRHEVVVESRTGAGRCPDLKRVLVTDHAQRGAIHAGQWLTVPSGGNCSELPRAIERFKESLAADMMTAQQWLRIERGRWAPFSATTAGTPPAPLFSLVCPIRTACLARAALQQPIERLHRE